MKRILIIVLALAVVLNGLLLINVFAGPSIDAGAYVLIDAKSGQVLYGKNIDQKMHPASTTKILTVILALEKGNLQDMVQINKDVPLVEGTKVYLREGEEVTLEALLNAAMVHSANDAALAVAENIGGSEKDFVNLMNEKAEEIGVKNSHFTNPHGLTAEEHYSTAYDLALLGRYAMQNPLFQAMAQKKVYDWEGEEWQTRLINKNKLLWSMSESTGIKTGYTTAAKNTIVASAEKDGQSLICVILSGNDVYTDAETLLKYGFNNFQSLQLADNNEVVAKIVIEDKEVSLVADASLNLALEKDKELDVEKVLHLTKYSLPIDKEEVLGELVIKVNGEEKERIPVKAMESVGKKFSWIRLIINLLAATFLLQICLRLWRKYNKKKRRQMFSSRQKYSSYRL